MRKLLLTLIAAAALAVAAVPIAVAAAPHHVILPAAACNQGTETALVKTDYNPGVPMFMNGFCMTMPGMLQP